MTEKTIADVLEFAPRAEELATRLVAAGPKAAHVSASETHEIADFVHMAILALRRQYLEAIAPVADERAAFEADFAKAWNAAEGNKAEHTASDVAKLREGDGYGHGLDYLNGRWAGWQARAALASAPVAKPKRAPVDDGICWSSKEIQRRQKEEDEARAAYYLSRTSAPVAGEAQDKIAYEIPTGSGTQRVRYTLNPQTGEFDTIATIIGEAAPVEHIMSLTNLPKEMLRTLTIGGASLPGDPPVETMPTSTAPLASTAAGEAQKPVAWFIDWPDEPELGHYIAESPADSGRNRPLVFADASTQESTPVPEEPVYAYRRKGMDDFVTCNRERFDELSAKPRLFETRIFYAAPQASEAAAPKEGKTYAEGYYKGTRDALATESAKRNAGYAGVTVWVGDKQVTQVVTKQILESSNADELLRSFEAARFTLSAQPDAEPLSNPKQFALTGTDERAAFEATYQADYDDPGAACEREHFGKGYRAGMAAQSTKEQNDAN